LKRLVEQVEKYLIRMAALSLLVLVLVQGAMTSDPIRFYLSWGERLEGQTISFPVHAAKETDEAKSYKSGCGYISISSEKYSSLPRTGILVNGVLVRYLDARTVEIEVRAGDTIAIDSRAYEFPIDYKITASSSNMAYPEKGQVYTTNQSLVTVGEVIVK
jgi:hypothetical protein